MSQSVRRFVAGHISSVWQLELLLLFKHSTLPLSAEQASRALYLACDLVAPALKRFNDSGILEPLPDDAHTYRYLPKSEALSQVIDELDKAYNQQRVRVINLIFSGPMQSFADSFRFKQEEDQ